MCVQMSAGVCLYVETRNVSVAREDEILGEGRDANRLSAAT